MKRSSGDQTPGRAEVHTELSSRPHASRAERAAWVDDSIPGEWAAADPATRSRTGGAGGAGSRHPAALLDRVSGPIALLDRARQHPLAALGIAVGVGFLLAGRSRGGRGSLMRAQLRGMIVGAVVASLRDEAEALVREHAGSLFGRGAGPRPERDFRQSNARSRGPGSPGY